MHTTSTSQLAAPIVVEGLTKYYGTVKGGRREYHLFFSPVVLGGDKRFLAGDTQVGLHLLEARTFE
jgi:hypothetical protein